MMMMLGDADQHAPPPPQPPQQQQVNQNNGNNGAAAAVNDAIRLQNALNFLKNTGFKQIAFRRRAAEELRVLLTSRPTPSVELKNDVIDVIVKILKKPKEDVCVLEQILWTITNLSHANSPLIHEMHPKDMVKYVAGHAKNSTAPAVRDQAVMCLGNIAADCQPCRTLVLQTNVMIPILDVLQTPALLTMNQRDTFAWTLQNIIRPSNASEVLSLSVYGRKRMMKAVHGLVTLPAPDTSIYQGIEILHDWVIGDSDKLVGQLVVGNESLMHHLLQMFEGDDDNVSSKIIRAIGNIAFNDDDVIQNIIDYGFVNAMEARVKRSCDTLEADIIWCLSNFLGSLRPNCIQNIYNRTELWEYLVRNCYDYDVRIRQEALFCVVNVVSFFKGGIQDELYHSFFGQLILDTLNGFTVEENTAMLQAVQGVLTHTNDELRQKNPNMMKFIAECNFEEAVRKRYAWAQSKIGLYDAGSGTKRELFKLLRLCADAINMVNNYKGISTGAMFSSQNINPLDSHALSTQASQDPSPIVMRMEFR